MGFGSHRWISGMSKAMTVFPGFACSTGLYNSNQVAFAIIDNCQMNTIGLRPTFKKKKTELYFSFGITLCIRQRKHWTSPPQGSTQIRRRDDVESWGVYFQGLMNLDLINFLTMWIFTLCEFRPGESWTNAVYISSENVLNTKIDCSKNVLLIVVLVEYKLKWMGC